VLGFPDDKVHRNGGGELDEIICLSLKDVH